MQCCSVKELLFQIPNKSKQRRMASSGMLRSVALVKTDVSEEESSQCASVASYG
jgi:hypothetical protein